MHQVPAPRPPLSRAGPMFFVQAKMANLPSGSEEDMLAFFHESDQMARDLWVMKRHHGHKGKHETPLIDNVMQKRDHMVDMAKCWSFVQAKELAQLNSMQ